MHIPSGTQTFDGKETLVNFKGVNDKVVTYTCSSISEFCYDIIEFVWSMC